MREIIGFIPGPLEAIFGETYTIREKDGGIVCMMSWLKGKFGCKGRRNEESVRATAELLAAAPGLYAECQTLSKRVEELEARLAQAERLLEECYEFVATPHHWREPWCKIAAFLHPEQVEKEKG